MTTSHAVNCNGIGTISRYLICRYCVYKITNCDFEKNQESKAIFGNSNLWRKTSMVYEGGMKFSSELLFNQPAILILLTKKEVIYNM